VYAACVQLGVEPDTALLADRLDGEGRLVRERSSTSIRTSWPLSRCSGSRSINTLPTEVANPIPGDVNRTNSAYDPDPVTRWWRIQLQTARVLDVYRSAFAGKSSPVNFYWGSFDLNHTRFSGRPAPRPHGPLFYQLAEDQENFACGFWPGSANMAGLTPGDAAFYAYIYPEPSGFREAAASLASWDRDALEARPPTRLHRRRTSC